MRVLDWMVSICHQPKFWSSKRPCLTRVTRRVMEDALWCPHSNFIYHTRSNKSSLLKWQPVFLFPSILPLSPKNSAKRSFKVIKYIIVCEHLLMVARGQACGVSSLLIPFLGSGAWTRAFGLAQSTSPSDVVTGPKRNQGWLQWLEKWGYKEKLDKEYVPKLENNTLFFCNLIFKTYFTHFHSQQ